MNRVKELREERGLKQTEMGATLGISQATISNWERGVHDPDNEALMLLSGFFDASIDYLLGNSDIRHIMQAPLSEDNAFFRIAADAKKSGIHPEDFRMAVEFLKKAKGRDDNTENEG